MAEKHPVLRTVANALPVLRMVAGPVIANKLRNTPPEQRTRKFAAVTALIASTDKLDGIIARQIGTTEFGNWLDQMADKAFVLPPLKALADNGEISPVHFYAKLGRDVAVSALRAEAERRNVYMPANQLGKLKATTEMQTIVGAASPLAAEQPLLESAAWVATGLSLASGLEHGINYVRGLRE